MFAKNMNMREMVFGGDSFILMLALMKNKLDLSTLKLNWDT